MKLVITETIVDAKVIDGSIHIPGKRKADGPIAVIKLPCDLYDTEVPQLVLRVRPNGFKAYYARYRKKDGTQTRAKLGDASTLTPTQARNSARAKLADLAIRGEEPNETKLRIKNEAIAARIEAITIREFLDGTYWGEVLSEKKAGADTKKRIERAFKDFLDRTLSDKTLGVAVENWRSKRIKGGAKNRQGKQTKKGVTESTINKDTNALRALFNEAVRRDLIQDNPLKSMKQFRDTGKRIVRFLDNNEETRLRAALEKRDNDGREARASKIVWSLKRKYDPPAPIPQDGFLDHLTPMVLISMNTGLRRGEVFGLRWADVAFAQKIPHLTIRGETSKSGGEDRHVPMNAECVDVLKRWAAQQEDRTGLVFPGRTGNEFDSIKKSWMGLLEDAKIVGFRWHDLRHHFASRLVQSGANLGVVCDLLGHSDFKLTQRYAHFAPSQKAQAVASIAFKPTDNFVQFPAKAEGEK